MSYLSKKELVEKTEKQIAPLEEQLSELQAHLKIIKSKTYRKKDLSLLMVYELSRLLTRLRGMTYCINLLVSKFLQETGKI